MRTHVGWIGSAVLIVAACSSQPKNGAGAGGGATGGQAGSNGQSGGAAGSTSGGMAGASSQGGAPTCDGNWGFGGAPPGGGGSGGVDVWERMLNWPKDTKPISGDALVADPVRHGDLYFFYEDYQPNGQPRHVLKSTDYGMTWTQIDKTAVVGNPWGVAIDPNPCRDPATPPTLYTPAGYGDLGIWKSTDGGVTWTNLFANASGGSVPKAGGGTVQFPPDKNGGYNDYYQIAILPDDSPNHILITYHYPNGPAPLGESKDGGKTWDVHLLPAGDSHYAYGIDASTWVVISGEGSGGGIYRTTSAGRVAGQISPSAWTQVSAMEHNHGAFTPFFDARAGNLYFPGKTGIERTDDAGATWTSVYTSPTSTLVGTASSVYAQALYSTAVLKAALPNTATWSPAPAPTDPEWWGGVPPFGAVSVFDGHHWVIVQAEYGQCSNNCQPPRSPLLANGEIWRYVEP